MPYRQNFPIPAVIDPPKKCLQIMVPDHPDWRAVLSGLLFELSYWFNWERTGDMSGAMCAAVWKQVYNSIDWSDMSCCCEDVAVIRRVNPDTGLVEQSTNGGATWTAAANTLASVIIQPIPPVTSGVAANKCDAAANLKEQVNVWISQVSTDFETAETLTAFATAVFEAILSAVLVILSAGVLTPIQAVVIPLIGGALAAAWGAGKVVFDDYWTDDNKTKILCAAYCTIGDDGSFTDGQFSAFFNECNSELSPSPAKMLFLGFISSVGAAGLNAMCASGTSSGSDCSDCECACGAALGLHVSDETTVVSIDEAECVYTFRSGVNAAFPTQQYAAFDFPVGVGATCEMIDVPAEVICTSWKPIGAPESTCGLYGTQVVEYMYFLTAATMTPFEIQVRITAP